MALEAQMGMFLARSLGGLDGSLTMAKGAGTMYSAP